MSTTIITTTTNDNWEQKYKLSFCIKNYDGSFLVDTKYEVEVINNKTQKKIKHIGVTDSKAETKKIIIDTKDSEINLKVNGKQVFAEDNEDGKYKISIAKNLWKIADSERDVAKKIIYGVENKEVQLIAFTQFKVISNLNSILANAVYEIRTQNKMFIGKGQLDKNGMSKIHKIPKHLSSRLHSIKVQMRLNDGKKHTFESKFYEPLSNASNEAYYKHSIGVSSAVTAPNKDHAANLSGKEILPFIFNPTTNQVYVMSDKDFYYFYNLSKQMEIALQDRFKTEAELNDFLADRSKTPEQIAEIEKKLIDLQKKSTNEINKKFGDKKGLDLHEFIVIQRSTNTDGSEKLHNFKYIYSNPSEYKEIKKRAKERTFNFKLTGPASSETKLEINREKVEKAVNVLVEPGTFKENLKKLQGKLTEELLSNLNIKKKFGDDDPQINEDFLTSWFDGIGHEYTKKYQGFGKQDVLSVDAQWFRFIAGAKGSVDAGITPDGVKIGANIEANAKAVLFEGKANWEYFIPSKLGVSVNHRGIDLCRLRLTAALALEGFVGANLALNGNVAIEVGASKGKQAIKAIKRNPKESIGGAIKQGIGLVKDVKLDRGSTNSQENYEIEESFKKNRGVDIEVDAFIGAELGVSPSIELSWLPPLGASDKKNPVIKDELEGNNYNSSVFEGGDINFERGEIIGNEDLEEVIILGGFKPLAKLAYTFAGNAGAGISGDLTVFIHQGRLRVRAAARLCWGLGGRGKLEFEVDVEQLLELAMFIKWQLIQTDFKHLELILVEDYKKLYKIIAQYAVTENLDLLKDVSDYMKKGGDLYEAWRKDIDSEIAITEAAQNISNASNKSILILTPDAKGLLLYRFTNTKAVLTKTFTDNPEMDVGSLSLSWAPDRKDGIITILASILTVGEWNNTMQRVTADGEKKSKLGIGQVEAKIVEFLASGINTGIDVNEVIISINERKEYKGDSNKWIDSYLKIKKSLIPNWPKKLNEIAINQNDPIFKKAQLMQDYEVINNSWIDYAILEDEPKFELYDLKSDSKDQKGYS